MSTVISSIDRRSAAERAGVRPGEKLISLNGHFVIDVLDYRFYGYDRDPELLLEEPDGSRRTLRVRKPEGEDLGLCFDTYLMDKARSCANRCVFCFVDQMPAGMRETLYFKDDDARLSFLLGNYLTLTNLSEREIQRIIDLRISPINVSVHTTDPELRCRMLQNRRAGESVAVMRRFAAHGIHMNCQIVACPGINDGAALDRSLRELGELYPAVESVAVVPVGLTRYREGLTKIDPYRPDQAVALVDRVEAFAAQSLSERGTRLAWCSDEFYLLSGYPLPEKAYYEEMNQLENGVGMLRQLQSQVDLALEEEGLEALSPSPFSVATGVSAAPFIREIAERVGARCPALRGTVYPIRNEFFGETITVSGLVTGRDLLGQLQGKDLGSRLLIPSNMLRAGERVFLDDVTVEELETGLKVPITLVESEDGFALVDALLDRGELEMQPIFPVREEDFYRYNPPTGRGGR